MLIQMIEPRFQVGPLDSVGREIGEPRLIATNSERAEAAAVRFARTVRSLAPVLLDPVEKQVHQFANSPTVKPVPLLEFTHGTILTRCSLKSRRASE
jgi:hypothetical protein